MSVSVKEFWKLVHESRLFDRDRCKELHQAFSRIPGASDQSNAIALSEWLIAEKHLTRYQSKILLARRSGPFLFGDYMVRDRIDSGRLAGSFRATHVPTKQPVCLHFFTGAATSDARALAKVSAVSAVAAGVQHVHLARHYQFVDLGTYKFFVGADLQGRSLDELLAGNRKMPAAEACRYARHVALGLSQVHLAQQAHAEVRPENIWIDSAGQGRLLHFPHWRDPLAGPTLSADQTLDAERLLVAANYLAPELAAGGRVPDVRSDLYALGCLLYHMLAGRPPFPGDDLARKLKQHQFDQPQSLLQLNPQAPPPVAQVAAYLMAKDPAQRYQQAAHAAEALLPYVDSIGAASKPEPATAEARAYEVWLLRNAPPTPPQPAAAKAPSMPMPPPTKPASPLPPAPPLNGIGIPAPVPFPSQFPEAGRIPQAIPVQSLPQAVPAFAVSQAVPQAVYAPQGVPYAAVAVQSVPAPFASPVSLPDVGERHTPELRVSTTRRVAKKDYRGAILVFSVVGMLAVAAAAAVYFNRSDDDSADAGVPSAKLPPSTANVADSPTSAVDEPAAAPPAGNVPPSETIVALDALPIWESPTAGPPLDLSYMPPGVQLFVSLRPAELWEHPEGAKVAATLGSFGDALRGTLLKHGGTELENIESATFGFLDAGGGRPALMALVVRAIDPIEEAALLKNWGDPEQSTVGDVTVYKAGGMTYWSPEKQQSKLLVASPLADDKQLEDWIAGAANQPALRREMEALVRGSDSLRHVNVLFAPNFLFAGGKSLFAGPLEKLREPLKYFLSDEAGNLPQACLLSLHLEDDLFLELRLHGSAEKTPVLLAKEFRARVQGLTSAVDDHLASLNVSPYSRKILLKYPRWIEHLDEFTRAGTSDKQAVLRCYLPGMAAQNLAFGTQLALLESGGGFATADSKGAAEGPKTLADVLKQKYTLVFPRDSLERTMEQIAKDLNITITILGGDLQLEGITKNQSFGLDEKEKPLGEILRTIRAKANMDGKLIYVIKKEGDKEVLFITTRAAAEKRKDPVPPEFQKK